MRTKPKDVDSRIIRIALPRTSPSVQAICVAAGRIVRALVGPALTRCRGAGTAPGAISRCGKGILMPLPAERRADRGD